MLQVTVPGCEFFDPKNNVFLQSQTITIELEHSLASLAKWEQKWGKPFLGKDPKTVEECIDYVRCMTLTENVDPLVYNGLTNEIFDQINKYMEAPMTATWFNDKDTIKKASRDVITAEIIYYWMIALNIPFECQYWHLNRLLTLVRVCNIKNAPKKGKKHANTRSSLSQRMALNKARREQLNSLG